jgi:UTP-glucose-1-phosphate uridylyltransferase
VVKELAMRDGSGVACYYSVFGQYILTPEVFEVLEKNIQEEESESGEIGMTEALVRFIGYEKFSSFVETYLYLNKQEIIHEE